MIATKTEYVDLYLRTDTEAEMIDALPWARGIDEAGNGMWITGTHDYALAVIGPLCTKPGTYGEDGEEIEAPVIDGRFHVNLRCKEAVAALVPAEVQIPKPETPLQTWA